MQERTAMLDVANAPGEWSQSADDILFFYRLLLDRMVFLPKYETF